LNPSVLRWKQRARGAGVEGRESPKPLTAARDGYSLNAAVACRPAEGQKLQRLCSYVARPNIASNA